MNVKEAWKEESRLDQLIEQQRHDELMKQASEAFSDDLKQELHKLSPEYAAQLPINNP